MNRIITSTPVLGICHMQVCAEKDVTDDEVLTHCNRDNPSGTSNGWSSVVRDGKNAPVPCHYDSQRLHILVGC